ncbi:sensor histidine kinase [Flavisolibacter tropicus]|nr:histidine kinase [Flavisolibacter tropicus]
MISISTITKKEERQLLVLYWIGYLVLFSFIQGFAAHDISTAFYNEVFSLPPKLVFVWLVTGPLMNRWFFAKRFGIFFLFYAMLLVVFAILLRLVDNYIILTYFLTHWSKQALLSTSPLVYNLVKLQFVVTIPFCFRLFQYWTREEQRAQAIQSEKLQAELHALQSQFHPHFMFNVLNSLYAKILTKSDDAADMLLRISSLLRFTVYEANGKTIQLEQELNYLRHYIALQELRFGSRVEVCFTVTGNTAGKMIEPFLILPFIENAFKYCLNNEEEEGWITIYVFVNEEQLSIQVENSLSKTEKADNTEDQQGFGIAHVQKRLELLYPGNYSLKLTPGKESFFVSLKLPLHAAC